MGNMKKYTTFVAIMMMCVMVITACGKEEYSTDFLKEVNVLPDEEVAGGVVSIGNVSCEVVGEISLVGEVGSEYETSDDIYIDEALIAEMEGGDYESVINEIINQGGDITLEDAIELMGGDENIGEVQAEGIGEGYGEESEEYEELVNSQELTMPSPELEQQWQDVISGEYEGEDEISVGVNNQEY